MQTVLIVENSTIIMSISQISETLFILASRFSKTIRNQTRMLNFNVRCRFCVWFHCLMEPAEIFMDDCFIVYRLRNGV
jgi:hypothetical protein